MKRRTLLTGLGFLASGSGAVATSAAVANSVQSASELSVVVDERLEIRAGQAFTDDGSVKSGYEDQYVSYDSNPNFFDSQNDTLADIDRSELPAAAVNARNKNINQDVKLQSAFRLRRNSDTFLFEDILEVVNYGGSSESIGIAYDRTDGTYDPNGQYGEAVNFDSASENTLTAHDVRTVYNFQVPNRFTGASNPIKISPAVGTQTPDSSNDEPKNFFEVDSGQTLQLDLLIDLSPYGGFASIDPRTGIESAIDKSPSFTGTIDTIDLLDAITVKIDNG